MFGRVIGYSYLGITSGLPVNGQQSAERATSTRLGSSKQLDVWFSNLLLFRTDMPGEAPWLHPRVCPPFVVPEGDHCCQNRMERLWPANHSSWQIRCFWARVLGG